MLEFHLMMSFLTNDGFKCGEECYTNCCLIFDVASGKLCVTYVMGYHHTESEHQGIIVHN
jgi:hypothetical protein